MSGYIRIQRGLFEHPAFHCKEPFSDREAWIWLIEHANWQPQRFRSGFVVFEVPRGALATHYRSLAAQWRWDHKKVIRFLKLLQSEDMIALETPHRTVQITLCNYDKYQRPWDSDAPTTPQPRPNDAPREGTKRIKGIKEIKETSNPPTPFPDWLPLQQWEDFKDMRQRIKAPMTKAAEELAIRQLDGLRARGFPPDQVLEQSIMRSWKGLFEIKQSAPGGNYGTPVKSKFDRLCEAANLARTLREQGEQEQVG